MNDSSKLKNSLESAEENIIKNNLMGKKILVIDDEADICDLVKDVLSDEGVNAYGARDGEEAIKFLAQNKVDCILSDVWMPKVDGISLISEIRAIKNHENTPIIMMSGHGTIESAVEATKKGVYDFIEKPLSIERLVLCVQNAINHYRLIQENQRLKKQSAAYVEPIGRSNLFESQKKQALKMATLGGCLFIFGERGVGKLTYARFIHDNTTETKEVFLHFNVNEFIEADEFFKILDEIKKEYHSATLVIENPDYLDSSLQEKLLFYIRSNKSFLFILLALSDENFSFKLKKETIHSTLTLAPLRKNINDLDELIRFYTDLITKQEQVNYRRFNLAAQNLLRNYNWPNNVEELVFLIRKLLITGGGVEISANELSSYLTYQKKNDKDDLVINFDEPLRESRDQFETKYFLYHLKKVKGSITKLATVTGMERTSLHRKIKQLGINYKDF